MRKVLPPRYYLTHFHEFLAFFDGANAPLLTTSAGRFISAFHGLDDNEQCIVVRAANRKYAIFDRNQFHYDEIQQPQRCIDTLIEKGWFSDIRNASPKDVQGALTKGALLDILACYTSTSGLRNLAKATLAEQLNNTILQYGWPQNLPNSPYLQSVFLPQLHYLLFLYFGHSRGRLNQFSMRDLGVMRTRQDAVNDVARFTTLEDAEAAWFYASQKHRIAQWGIKEAVDVARTTMPSSDDPTVTSYRDSFLYELGLKLLVDESELALELLAQATSDKAQEKWVRESYKRGQRERVKKVLEQIIDVPTSETILAFAEDFYARKFNHKRTSVLTDMLREATQTLAIDECHNQEVERGVMAWYRRQGTACWRTENRLWLSLFGLTFWQLLYEQDTLVTEFDRRPLSLKHNNVYTRFESQIEALLTALDTPKQFAHHVKKMASAHYGKVNSLFMWSSSLLDPINALFEHGCLDATKSLLRMMCQDFNALKDGFPDIMVYTNEGLRFEEIKSPGDQLRRNQLVSIQKMKQAGFDVRITAVNWVRDPKQPYVVVDIETTGGGNTHHRITEIGMVKLVDGEVVDTYQSLVNPQRHIPASITRLTGISNDMVSDAPLFVEIADDIEQFTQDAVFVAHNVNFDYGFIKQEFERLERPFRRPKLCTVREMRKAKPGLPSYSLANLTAHFDIQMEQHHRALSDAKAAAQLLNIAFGLNVRTKH